MARICPNKWGDFQHYKDRNPTWIKLHKKILDDHKFQRLPLASRALAPMLWLLASEDKDGWIDADYEALAFRLRVSEAEICDALKPLIESGFFVLEDSDSATLAEIKRGDSPEKENKKQVKTEKQVEKNARSANADEAAALRAYNSVAGEFGWPLAQRVTAKRQSALKARLRDCGGIAGWEAAMAKARGSPFLRGETGRDKAHERWSPDLDFFLQESSFTKLMEGKYDNRNSRQEPSGFDALRQGAGRAAGMDGQQRQGVDPADDPIKRLADLGGASVTADSKAITH